MKVFTTLKFGKIEIEKVPFLISEDGKIIINCETDFVHKTYLERNGYKRVSIFDKIYTVHSLVARAFWGDCPKGMQVDHIDRNKLNNHYLNLRYVTFSEQMKNRDYTKINSLNREKSKLAGAVLRKKIMLKKGDSYLFFNSVKGAIHFLADYENLKYDNEKAKFYRHLKSGKKICGYEIFYDGEEQDES